MRAIVKVVVVWILGLVVLGPTAVSLALTREEKEGILTRCLKAGGTVKACCAAADGTYTSDSSGGKCTISAAPPTPPSRSPRAIEGVPPAQQPPTDVPPRGPRPPAVPGQPPAK